MAKKRVVNLDEIEQHSESELIKSKILGVENSVDSLDTQINSKDSPIALDSGGKGGKLQIIDGRHRIFVARKNGYTKINALVLCE